MCFCFLCSCQSAINQDTAFSGVAQQLLAREGGDLASVVATQANLRVKGSTDLIDRFYRLLVNERLDPARALNAARNAAYHDAIGWSVPIVLQRPRLAHDPSRPHALDHHRWSVPPPRSNHLPRDEETTGITALSQHRLVALVGLPGIGKTEIGRAVARQAQATKRVQKVVYEDVQSGDTGDTLRARLASSLGMPSIDSDAELAVLFSQLGDATLLVLDNAEDLMLDTSAEMAFATQLDTLLSGAPSLRILLTTRWLPLTSAITLHAIEIPQLSIEQSSDLLRSELIQMGVFVDTWPEVPGWSRLLELIDGHARSLWLIAHHFHSRNMTPERVATLLERKRATAVVDDPGLIGRPEILVRISDRQKQRLKSLVGSMDLSLDVLHEQHPEAAKLFRILSLYPTGLPEAVAEAVADQAAGDTGGMPLMVLQRYHLIAWQNLQRRYFYPVPLQWYASWLHQRMPIDTADYDQAALQAFADFTELTHQQLLEDTRGAIERLLPEESTLLMLASRISPDPNQRQSLIARIATAGRDSFQIANREMTAQRLADLGLQHARACHDRLGEANCLKSLGDLLLRVADLDGARKAYEEALPIYREIRERLGEANCLQSLGDLLLRVADLDGARKAYEEALPIYREIRELAWARPTAFRAWAICCFEWPIWTGRARPTRRLCRFIEKSASAWARPTAFRAWAICCFEWPIWTGRARPTRRLCRFIEKSARAWARPTAFRAWAICCFEWTIWTGRARPTRRLCRFIEKSARAWARPTA